MMASWTRSALVLAVVLSGCGGGSGTKDLPAAAVIDLSHAGTQGNGFGDTSRDGLELKRFQTFVAVADYPILTSVEVKVRRYGPGSSFSPVVAELYATDSGGLPTGAALASGSASQDLVPVDKSFAVVELALDYTGLVAGTAYAVVLGEQTPANDSHYEWCDHGTPTAGLHFGKLMTGHSEWTDESGNGDGWLKVHVALAE
jgi:hypothetical protein